jgi:catechol 2,3-dioxygenase-like lactoylglutathione lyase family enzyme
MDTIRSRSISLAMASSMLLSAGTPSAARAFEMIGLDHFAVNVRSLDASTKWYSDVFGFVVLHKWNGVVMVGRGNIKVGLFERPKAEAVGDQDNKLLIGHVAILVDGDKFDDALTEMKARGIAVEGPEDTGIAYSFFVRDPDGHQIEVTSYHGKSAPKP